MTERSVESPRKSFSTLKYNDRRIRTYQFNVDLSEMEFHMDDPRKKQVRQYIRRHT